MAPPRKPTEDEIVNVFIDMDGEKRKALMKRMADADEIATRVEEKYNTPPFVATEPDQTP